MTKESENYFSQCRMTYHESVIGKADSGPVVRVLCLDCELDFVFAGEEFPFGIVLAIVFLGAAAFGCFPRATAEPWFSFFLDFVLLFLL